MFPKRHKLYDPEFQAATGGMIDCHPMYHQVRLELFLSLLFAVVATVTKESTLTLAGEPWPVFPPAVR